jgi:hypothetical protein
MATVVTVLAPYQVALNGTVYAPGETAEVPDAVAKQWQAHGWVKKAEPPPKKAATKKAES